RAWWARDLAVRLGRARLAGAGRAHRHWHLRRPGAHLHNRELPPGAGFLDCAVRLHLDALGAGARLCCLRRTTERTRFRGCRHYHGGGAGGDLARAPAWPEACPRGGEPAAQIVIGMLLSPEGLEGDDRVRVLYAWDRLDLLVDEMADIRAILDVELHQQ